MCVKISAQADQPPKIEPLLPIVSPAEIQVWCLNCDHSQCYRNSADVSVAAVVIVSHVRLSRCSFFIHSTIFCMFVEVTWSIQ